MKGKRRKNSQVITIVDGQEVIAKEQDGDVFEYFAHTFVIENDAANTPHRIRILGLNKKKKVISAISRRIR